MLEIKVTGNTAEEVRKDLLELAKFFDMQLSTGEVVINPVSTTSDAEETAKEDVVKEEVANEEAAQGKEDGQVSKNIEAEQTGETEQAETTKEAEAEEPKYTLEEVRAKAAALQRAGSKDLVKSVITGSGASKLTEVDPSKYNWMMACFENGKVID